MNSQGKQPTHVFLQSGVGSFAAAIAAFLHNKYPENPPRVIVFEPYNAGCLYKSAQQGALTEVDGDLETMCAGMACGIPSSLAWPILRDIATAFVMHSDNMAGNGMILSKENGVEAGECGGVGLGILNHVMTQEDEMSTQFCNDIGLDSSSVVCLINTEGATDPVNYEKVVSAPM